MKQRFEVRDARSWWTMERILTCGTATYSVSVGPVGGCFYGGPAIYRIIGPIEEVLGIRSVAEQVRDWVNSNAVEGRLISMEQRHAGIRIQATRIGKENGWT
jgi:hypothetical protein